MRRLGMLKRAHKHTTQGGKQATWTEGWRDVQKQGKKIMLIKMTWDSSPRKSKKIPSM